MKIKKSLMGMFLVSVLLLNSVFTAFAGEYKEETTVELDMEVRMSPDTPSDTWPGHSTLSRQGSTAEVDMRTTLYTGNVWSIIADYYDTMNTAYDFTNNAEMKQKLDNMKITGEFTIEIIFPKSVTPTEEFLNGSEMYGFNDKAKNIFKEVSREIDSIRSNSEQTVMVIKVKVAEPLVNVAPGGTRADFVYVSDFMEKYKSDYLPETLTLQAEDIAVSGYGQHTVIGKFSGTTNTYGNSVKLLVTYNGVQKEGGENPLGTAGDISATVVLTGGGGSTTKKCTITFSVEGDKDIVPSLKKDIYSKIDISEFVIPHKDGYRFDGWYYDEQCTIKVDKDFVLNNDLCLYGKWEKSKTASHLIADDHFAYVVGYPDGTVQPEGNITREEITTIFFRLLKDEYRTKIMDSENSFPDVDVKRWSNKAISTMENGRYVTGYEDGTFRPGNPITRAEFATIASKLDIGTEDNEAHSFADVEGHWSEKYVAAAVKKGWLAGYDDGLFKPDRYITRAEAMAVINRMLNRHVNEEGLHKDAILWPDNSKEKWYYYSVEEATNSHDFERMGDGVYEKWTKVTENRDWAALEAAE